MKKTPNLQTFRDSTSLGQGLYSLHDEQYLCKTAFNSHKHSGLKRTSLKCLRTMMAAAVAARMTATPPITPPIILAVFGAVLVSTEQLPSDTPPQPISSPLHAAARAEQLEQVVAPEHQNRRESINCNHVLCIESHDFKGKRINEICSPMQSLNLQDPGSAKIIRPDVEQRRVWTTWATVAVCRACDTASVRSSTAVHKMLPCRTTSGAAGLADGSPCITQQNQNAKVRRRNTGGQVAADVDNLWSVLKSMFELFETKGQSQI
jgi:hypothetical protein